MDIPWGSKESRAFITNVGLITTLGESGQNIMACEWTHHVSYRPGYIAISVDKENLTNENIKKTKEFGVSIASVEQRILASVAGGYSGSEYNKIKALEKLGVKFYAGKKIKPLMVQDAVLNVECKVYKEVEFETHTLFIGEAVEVSLSDKVPLCFHQGKYWKLNETFSKPSDAEREEMKKIVESFKLK